MHIEEIHRAPNGWRDFFRQFAMIVVSILTALAFETAFVNWHDRQRAAESRIRIEAELQRNQADLKTCIARDSENMRSFGKTLHDIAGLVRAGIVEPEKLKPVMTPSSLGLSLCTNTWQRDAWDSAIADQSASHLALDDLRRYTEIYTTARDNGEMSQTLLGSNWTGQLAAIEWDLQTGKPDAHAVAIFLAQLMITMQNIVNSEKDLLEKIDPTQLKKAQ